MSKAAGYYALVYMITIRVRYLTDEETCSQTYYDYTRGQCCNIV